MENGLPQTKQETLTKMFALLAKIPAGDRARFARNQLQVQYPQIVEAFGRIPAERLSKSVLFLSTIAHSREARLAAAARLGGWDPYLVYGGQVRYNPDERFLFHASVQDAIQQVLVSWLFPGALVHAFALRGDLLAVLAELKPRRLVIDIYDTGAGSLATPAELVRLEKWVISKADGITHRDLRIKRLARAGQCVLPARNILIHDPLPLSASSTLLKLDMSEIHVVSSGWVGSGDNSILRFSDALCSKGVHLHVYLNPFQTRNLPEVAPYFHLAESKENFHVHEQVYGDQYWDMLRTHHFGLSVTESCIFGEKLKQNTDDAFEGCGSSRVADYVCAGLGVLVSPKLKFINLFSRHYASSVVEASRAFLENPVPILRKAYDLRSPKDLSSIGVSGIAERLGKFYEWVSQ